MSEIQPKKQNTHSAYGPIAYHLVKPRLSESEAEENKPITTLDSRHFDGLVLPLLLPTPTIYFSLDHKQWSRKRNWKKWKCSDFSNWFRQAYDSNSNSEFHYVVSSSLTTTTMASENQP